MDGKKQLRGIVAKRLSHLTDVTTHLETESESIEEYCRRKNILVVAETEDLDVSGGKPIKERPGPVGFESIQLHFDVAAPNATPEQMSALKEKTEQYCVVMQTLTHSPKLQSNWLRHD